MFPLWARKPTATSAAGGRDSERLGILTVISGMFDGQWKPMEHFQKHFQNFSVLQDVHTCSEGKNRVCGQDGFTDDELNKSAQLSARQDFPGSFTDEDAFGNFQEKEGVCGISKTVTDHGVLLSKKILRTCGGKGVSWEVWDWHVLAFLSLAKTLPNSGSKTVSTMLLSHFENCFDSTHLSTFHVLSINESISRGNRIPWRSVLGGFILSWIPLLPSI